jgi:hypothetical protein
LQSLPFFSLLLESSRGDQLFRLANAMGCLQVQVRARLESRGQLSQPAILSFDVYDLISGSPKPGLRPVSKNHIFGLAIDRE